jgi:hypothetical protein
LLCRYAYQHQGLMSGGEIVDKFDEVEK